jgi:hypothetical protein
VELGVVETRVCTETNTGDLKNRLRRLELYGSTHAHPSLPRMRAPEHNKNIIFDVHGVTSIDGSGTQVLSEIVHAYAEQRVRVFFCRLPNIITSPAFDSQIPPTAAPHQH